MNTPSDIHADETLGDIVTRRPGSARVFESFGLDYCCGGQRSLDEACTAHGVEAAVVRDALDAVEAPETPDWAVMDPAALVDHLESTHHAYLHAELPLLRALAEKVATVHGGRHPELLDVLAAVEDLRGDLEPHLRKEERMLFPMIRELCAAAGPVQFNCGSLRNPISVMLAEHDTAGALLSRLRDHSGDFVLPSDACASYRSLYERLADLEADTHLHVHKENNLLFPAVVALEDRVGTR